MGADCDSRNAEYEALGRRALTDALSGLRATAITRKLDGLLPASTQSWWPHLKLLSLGTLWVTFSFFKTSDFDPLAFFRALSVTLPMMSVAGLLLWRVEGRFRPLVQQRIERSEALQKLMDGLSTAAQQTPPELLSEEEAIQHPGASISDRMGNISAANNEAGSGRSEQLEGWRDRLARRAAWEIPKFARQIARRASLERSLGYVLLLAGIVTSVLSLRGVLDISYDQRQTLVIVGLLVSLFAYSLLCLLGDVAKHELVRFLARETGAVLLEPSPASEARRSEFGKSVVRAAMREQENSMALPLLGGLGLSLGLAALQNGTAAFLALAGVVLATVSAERSIAAYRLRIREAVSSSSLRRMLGTGYFQRHRDSAALELPRPGRLEDEIRIAAARAEEELPVLRQRPLRRMMLILGSLSAIGLLLLSLLTMPAAGADGWLYQLAMALAGAGPWLIGIAFEELRCRAVAKEEVARHLSSDLLEPHEYGQGEEPEAEAQDPAALPNSPKDRATSRRERHRGVED